MQSASGGDVAVCCVAAALLGTLLERFESAAKME